MTAHSDYVKVVTVSVPFRGFRGLQGASAQPSLTFSDGVSVPFRGFRGLQADEIVRYWEEGRLFQSPSGVLGVCRNTSRKRSGLTSECFSPLAGF